MMHLDMGSGESHGVMKVLCSRCTEPAWLPFQKGFVVVRCSRCNEVFKDCVVPDGFLYVYDEKKSKV